MTELHSKTFGPAAKGSLHVICLGAVLFAVGIPLLNAARTYQSAVCASKTSVTSSDRPSAFDKSVPGIDALASANPEVVEERRLRRALSKTISVDFVETPLSDVLTKLGELAGVSVAVNVPKIGVTPITLRMQQVPIAGVLAVLKYQKLITWYFQDSQLMFDVLDTEQDRLVTRYYPVGRLKSLVTQTASAWKEPLFAIPRDNEKQIFDESQVLANIISENTSGGWEFDGSGTGTIELVNNVLMIRQSQRVHWEIEHVLEQLEALACGSAPAVSTLSNDEIEHLNEPLRRQLDKPRKVVIEDLTIDQFAAYLRRELECEVWVDTNSLAASGSIEKTLRIDGATKSLSEAITQLGRNTHLSVVVESGIVWLVSWDEAMARLLTRIYNVQDLTDRQLTVKFIARNLSDETSGGWEFDGSGAGQMKRLGKSHLLIHQTPQVHNEIERQLKVLDRVLQYADGKPARQ